MAFPELDDEGVSVLFELEGLLGLLVADELVCDAVEKAGDEDFLVCVDGVGLEFWEADFAQSLGAG